MDYLFEQFGLVTGTYAISQLPDIPCSMVRFKARSSNAGSIFIGSQYTTGSVFSMPYELDAGDDTGWFETDNLNRYYQGGSSGTSYLAYWAKK